MKKFIKGFSLIEMLVVITIMGIIMSAMVVEYSNYIDKSETAVAKQELSQILQVVEMSFSTRSAYIMIEDEKFIINGYSDIEEVEDLIFIYETETGTTLPKDALSLDTLSKTISYLRETVTVTYNYDTRKFIG